MTSVTYSDAADFITSFSRPFQGVCDRVLILSRWLAAGIGR
jgi:hypothetical protein